MKDKQIKIGGYFARVITEEDEKRLKSRSRSRSRRHNRIISRSRSETRKILYTFALVKVHIFSLCVSLNTCLA